MPFCTHCGHEVSDSARICPNCSLALSETSETPPLTAAIPELSPEATPGGQIAPETTLAQPLAGQTGKPAGSKTDPGAIWALILGVIGLVFCWTILSGILSLPAIIVGLISERRIKQSGGELGGEGLAKAGWITGIIGTVLTVFFLIAIALFVFAFSAISAPAIP